MGWLQGTMARRCPTFCCRGLWSLVFGRGRGGRDRQAKGEGNLQGLVHFFKRLLCLFEEAKYNGLAEFAIVLTVVHLQDLTKSGRVDGIPKIGKVGVTSIMLSGVVHISIGAVVLVGALFGFLFQLTLSEAMMFFRMRKCGAFLWR
jgi:hypothetical protein